MYKLNLSFNVGLSEFKVLLYNDNKEVVILKNDREVSPKEITSNEKQEILNLSNKLYNFFR